MAKKARESHALQKLKVDLKEMVSKHAEGNVKFSTSSLERLVMNFKLQQDRFGKSIRKSCISTDTRVRLFSY